MSATYLRPFGDRVVIRTEHPEEEKFGHIIIPKTVKDPPKIGIVVAIGTDDELNEHINVGDRVMHAKYGGTEVRINHEDYVVCCFNDILGAVEEVEESS